MPPPTSPGHADNPFYYGGMITEPRYFVGRRRELSQIFSALSTLLNGQAQHVNVVGPPRIGKSSLLYRVTQVHEHYLGPNPLVFLYLDTYDLPNPRDFYRCLVERLPSSLGDSSVTVDVDARAVEKALERAKSSGMGLVLLVDEIGRWCRKESFGDPFFEQLRAWMNAHLVAMVVASRVPLPEIVRAIPLESPFFNVFGTLVEVGPFTEEEAEELLEKGRKCARPFTAAEAIWMKRWARWRDGYHPARLQLAARELYEAKAHPPVNLQRLEKDVDRVWKTMVEHEEPPSAHVRAFLNRAFVSWPAVLGQVLLDLLGKKDAARVTKTVVGWGIIVVILLLISGVISWQWLIETVARLK